MMAFYISPRQLPHVLATVVAVIALGIAAGVLFG
jgi:hypothetical protein